MNKITTEATTTTQESNALDASTRHRVLTAERRRLVCEVVHASTRSTFDLDHLATTVAERDPAVDATDEDERDRVAASLHHVHLPRLDDAELAEYDPTEHTVTTDADAIASLLH